MSLYADYLRERLNDEIVEDGTGFATYRYLPEQKAVYIIDLFVIPEMRQHGYAKALADVIVSRARAKGVECLLGTVVPSLPGATRNMKVLLAYGMDVYKAQENLIVFRKDI